MILKSLSRKTPSFGQLLHYFDKHQAPGHAEYFTRNMFATADNKDAVEQEFLHNFQYLPQRSNGNAMYHEILVLTQNTGVSTEKEDQVLRELADLYCQLRAPNQLVFGRIHTDKEHRHMHLMISSNSIKSPKRCRLKKADFSQIQQRVEQHLLDHFPELSVAPIYTCERDPSQRKAPEREQALEQRTKAPSKKAQLQAQLVTIFEQSYSAQELRQALEDIGWRLYKRGKQQGVEPLDTGRRYRFGTLGVQSDYDAFLERSERTGNLTKQRDAASREPKDTAHDAHQPKSPDKANLKTPVDPREAMLQRIHEEQERFAEDHLKEFGGESV